MNPNANDNRTLTASEIIGAAAAIFALLVPLGLPAAVAGWKWMAAHVHDRKAIKSRSIAVAISVALLTLATISVYAHEWSVLANALISGANMFDLLIAVVVMLPLSTAVGYGAGMAGRVVWLSIRTRHPLEGRAIADKEATRVRELRADLSKRTKDVPLLSDRMPVLGVRLDGVGDERWHVGDFTRLDTSVAHVVAIGQSGAGKSESILRIAAAHMAAGWRVFCIDAKEDHAMAERFRSTSIKNGIDPARALTWPRFGPIDLFRGPAHAVADRLMACAAWTEPYYRAVAATLLLLTCEDPTGAPVSMDEVVQRLDPIAIKTRWAGTERARIAAHLTASDVQGVSYRYFDLAASLFSIGGIARQGGGWSWEDVDSAWITLPTSTRPGAAAAFGRALLVDLTSYIRDAERRTDHRPILLIIEELGAIVSADPSTALLVIEAVERARSANVRAILSVQTPEGLGDIDARARILHGGPAVLAHRMVQPEPMVELCGTTYGHESSLGIDSEGNYLDRGSVREQHQYRLPPARLRELPTGQAILIHRGCWSHVAIPRVSD